jgi:hypothetical protein
MRPDQGIEVSFEDASAREIDRIDVRVQHDESTLLGDRRIAARLCLLVSGRTRFRRSSSGGDGTRVDVRS